MLLNLSGQFGIDKNKCLLSLMSARLSFLSLIFADKKMSNSDDDFQDLPDPPYTPMPSLKNATKQKFKPPISKKPDIVKKPYFELKNNELISLKVNDD